MMSRTQMKKATLKLILATAAALVNGNSLSAGAVEFYARPNASVIEIGGADADCSHWNAEDKLRCFECLRQAWNGYRWQWINTCHRRHYQ